MTSQSTADQISLIGNRQLPTNLSQISNPHLSGQTVLFWLRQAPIEKIHSRGIIHPMTVPSLINSLSYAPVPLKFGTSGRRGKVADLSQLEIYINARAEIQYLQCLYPEEGGV